MAKYFSVEYGPNVGPSPLCGSFPSDPIQGLPRWPSTGPSSPVSAPSPFWQPGLFGQLQLSLRGR